MPSNSLLGTNTLNLNEILGISKIYKVPTYQRNYSWNEENWEDLWNDILECFNSESIHYMGSIVFQEKGDKEFAVIDGQQRLTTLSIIIISLLKKIQNLIDHNIEPEENKQRLGILRNQYLGSKDPSSLNYSSKLELNENNDPFYQQVLINFGEPVRYNKLESSDKLMWDAFNFFSRKINELFNENTSGKELSEFLNKTIAEKLLFIEIRVQDELSAYTVFETLNSRGVELTAADLLKNFLFSKVSESKSDLDIAKSNWHKITATIGLKSFPTFLRHFINSRKRLVTKDRLFKSLKLDINEKKDVFQLLKSLEEAAYTYMALGNPNDELWLDNKANKQSVLELKLFRNIQSKSLLLICHQKLSPKEFSKVLKMLSVISFRYNVISSANPKLMEVTYNKAAIKVNNGILISARDVFDEIKQAIYLSDEQFVDNFKSILITQVIKKLLGIFCLK